MITLRRADERHLDLRHRQELWHSFKPQEQAKPHAGGFGALESLSENRLPPGRVSVSRPSQEAEIVTYVFKGAIAQEDSTGSSGVVHAGEFQRSAIGDGIRHKETNASRTAWAHIFRISLRPSEIESNGACEQMRVAAAQRHNVLRIVTSPDGRQGSLHTHQDALIYSSVIDPGHHLIHELLPGRSAWLHVICGEAAFHDIILAQGDGVGVTNERSVSLTAREKCEILLVDVAEQDPGMPGRPAEPSQS
jgi:redox-sensitive bicupin YhaK (pirin superfamily)